MDECGSRQEAGCECGKMYHQSIRFLESIPLVSQLFPVEISYKIPNPFPSADLKEVAVGIDGCEYAAKSVKDHACLPASEWFCYHLAGRVQLALPAFATLLDGPEEVFGSRFEGGATQWAKIAPAEQVNLLTTCGRDMSRILALDLLVGNDDRHLNNFLFRDQQLGGGKTVFAMDFSRSLFIRGWPKDVFPMHSNSKTMMVMGILKSINVWDSTAAQVILTTIQSISNSEIAGWLNNMPKSWKINVPVDEAIHWWGTTSFDRRIAECIRLV